MALPHCKTSPPPHVPPCHECSKLRWEIDGAREKLAVVRAETEQMQRRLDALLADRRYART